MQDQEAVVSLETLVPSLTRLASLSPLVSLADDGVLLEKFLHFAIADNVQMLLPVTVIAEVQKITLSDVLPVPHVPAWVLGLHYRQGEALWVIDFAHLLGTPLIYKAGSALMNSLLIVLNVDGKRLGLVVPEVYDIELQDLSRFKPIIPESMPAQLTPMVAGYDSDSGLILLNPQHIVKTETLVPESRIAQLAI